MPEIFLRKTISDRIGSGHPWVFDNEIGELRGFIHPGDIAPVFSSNGAFVGRGFYNPGSKIRVRLLSRDITEPIDEDFFRKYIVNAVALRKTMQMPDYGRLVAGEADFLPGLIIDRYGTGLVLQTLALGMDAWKKQITDILIRTLEPEFIVERNDARVRLLEGLPLVNELVYGSLPEGLTLNSPYLKWQPDLRKGPATGVHWEQFWLGEASLPFVADARVLDTFCYNGITGLHAAAGGALQICGIDQDPEALRLAGDHAVLNGGAARCHYIHANVFDWLKAANPRREQWDVIILNPPSLIKNKRYLHSGLNGYRELNLRAMRLLSPGGFLVTAFHSYLLDESEITEIFNGVGKDLKRSWRLLSRIHAGRDHPVLKHLPQTDAFRAFVLQVF